MAKHRSLDAFGAEEKDGSTDRLPTAISEGIYSFYPEGISCDVCDQTTQQIWNDGRTAVCHVCKEW